MTSQLHVLYAYFLGQVKADPKAGPKYLSANYLHTIKSS